MQLYCGSNAFSYNRLTCRPEEAGCNLLWAALHCPLAPCTSQALFFLSSRSCQGKDWIKTHRSMRWHVTRPCLCSTVNAEHAEVRMDMSRADYLAALLPGGKAK